MQAMSECLVCFHKFSSHLKPLIVPCGHTACENCLKKMIKGRILPCPVCRKEFPADFSLFPINFSLITESAPPVQETSHRANKLQIDIQVLEETFSDLCKVEEEFQNFGSMCENELISCIKSLIQSLEQTRAQLKHKIENTQNSNQRKISQYKKDVQTSLELRKKVLKALMDSERNHSHLDSSITIELNVLRDIKPIDFKLQKLEFDHLITLMSSNISETLTKNLLITDVPVSLGSEKNYPKSIIRTDTEDRGSSFKAQPPRPPSGLNVNPEKSPNWGDLTDSESALSGSNPENARRGRRPNRNRRYGRGRKPQNDSTELQNPETHEEKNEHWEGRRWNRPHGRRGRGGRDVEGEERKIQIPVRVFNAEGGEERKTQPVKAFNAEGGEEEAVWSILLGSEQRRLPEFVRTQINRFYKKHPVVRIMKEGKIVNLADTVNMKYFQVDETGNRTSSHNLVRG